MAVDMIGTQAIRGAAYVKLGGLHDALELEEDRRNGTYLLSKHFPKTQLKIGVGTIYG